MFIVGTLMGPMHHAYYIYLDKLLPRADLKTVFKKIFYDQIIASPATIICFFYGMGFLESKSIKECNNEITKKFKYVYTVSTYKRFSYLKYILRYCIQVSNS